MFVCISLYIYMLKIKKTEVGMELPTLMVTLPLVIFLMLKPTVGIMSSLNWPDWKTQTNRMQSSRHAPVWFLLSLNIFILISSFLLNQYHLHPFLLCGCRLLTLCVISAKRQEEHPSPRLCPVKRVFTVSPGQSDRKQQWHAATECHYVPLIPRDGDTTALITGSTRLTDSWAGVV